MIVECDSCLHSWNYLGSRLKYIGKKGVRVYVSCPVCKKNININK